MKSTTARCNHPSLLPAQSLNFSALSQWILSLVFSHGIFFTYSPHPYLILDHIGVKFKCKVLCLAKHVSVCGCIKSLSVCKVVTILLQDQEATVPSRAILGTESSYVQDKQSRQFISEEADRTPHLVPYSLMMDVVPCLPRNLPRPGIANNCCHPLLVH